MASFKDHLASSALVNKTTAFAFGFFNKLATTWNKNITIMPFIVMSSDRRALDE
jgi:hypothetical protein